MNLETTKLTDKIRYDLAQGRILTSIGDFELKKYQPNKVPGKPTLPAVPGGIFDPTIFGSPYTYRCECGFTEGQGKTCPRCHSHINTEEESLTAIGLIKSPIYFINPIALEGLNVLMKKTFTGMPTLNLDLLYTRFFQYDSETNRINLLTVDDLMNPDFTELSIEGIIKIFEKYKRNSLDKLMELVQRYIIVRPVSMRPWSYTYKSWIGSRVLEKHQLNFQYQSLIYITNELTQSLNISEMSSEDIVYSFASIRLAISKIINGMSDLIKSSKASSIRQGFGTRVPNSSRAVAVADPNLEINQVSLPIGMCFEIFRSRFVTWYLTKFGITSEEVDFKLISRDKEMLESFKEFVNTSELYVMINRAPTLYKLSQLAFRVTLNESSVIGYSLMATTPLNLDFDGDTLAVYEIPEHLNEEAFSMLPSNLDRYMKSDAEVILPKQETLIGLMIASKFSGNNDRSSEIILRDFNQASEKYSEGLFSSNDLITIGTKITTYGREKLSSILGFELDYEITPQNISNLVTSIKGSEGYVGKMKDLQDFGLEVSTFDSSADISLENLSKMAETTKSLISDTGDSVKAYSEALKINKHPNSLSYSIKGTPSSISSIVAPQLIYDGYNFSLTSDSMLNNMTATEYIRISAEFRKVQQIKVNSVGESGYLARQIWTAMSRLVYSDLINIHPKLLEIIPDVDGFRYANGVKIPVKKGEKVRVDSAIYGGGSVISKNDLFADMQFKEGHLLGVDLGMQLSEGTTQGVLQLKHAGSYIEYSNYGLLTADSDCIVKHDSDFIYINESKFLKSSKFTFVDPNKVEYSKGELIGINPTLVTPNTNLYLSMKLIKALGSTDVASKPKRYISLYSINSGRVEFQGRNVKIGQNVYVMPIESLCLVYEGQEVEAGTKLFTGPLDYAAFVAKYSSLGINLIYKVFEAELLSFIKVKKFLAEVLFTAIHYIDVLDNGTEVLTFRGVANSIDPSTDLLTSLTFGFIKSKVSKFIASDSSSMGESNIINVAYQFNGLRLMNESNKLISDIKSLDNHE